MELEGRLRGFIYVRCLWSFLALDDLEFDWVPFLQALVAVRGDGTVVNEDIRTTFATDEPITLGIVKPLDGTFQTFHLRPLGTPQTEGFVPVIFLTL